MDSCVRCCIGAVLALAGVASAAASGGGEGTTPATSPAWGRPDTPWDGQFRAWGIGRRGAAIPQPAIQTEPRVHDPVLIKEGPTWYLYCTGGGIMSWRSPDLTHWERNTPPTPATSSASAGGGALSSMVLHRMPDWAMKAIPGARDLWAPDISYFNGLYHLYYSVSTFGSSRSAIGLATSPTLDPAAKNYAWTDRGMVLDSHPDDHFNAIDPNLVLDDHNTPWLTFGSFWSGIKLVKLDPAGKRDPADPRVYSLATRKDAGGAIEAPFLVLHDRHYYLFASFDLCCRGTDSTYRVMVGRADAITGPYLDKQGRPMLDGGGTEVLAGDGKRIFGPGHCAVVKDDTGGPGGKECWLMVHHFYDGNDRGQSKLQVRELRWQEGWPVVGEAINVPK